MIEFFDKTKLIELANKYKSDYVSASPFPHIVIDNFLPEEVLNQVLKEFPDPKKIDWVKFNNVQEKKLASSGEEQISYFTRSLIHQLNSSVFINFLEELTEIKGLIPDPHLWGGGLRQIEKGGLLKIHADFNWYAKLRINRRLNILIYLNKDWKEEYGGHIELWNKDMTKCEQKILPLFNRCVIFSTTDNSYHGHPEPLTCPGGWTRKSLALYYYTSNGIEDTQIHSTNFKTRPGEEKTLRLRDIFKRITPPIIYEVVRSRLKN